MFSVDEFCKKQIALHNHKHQNISTQLLDILEMFDHGMSEKALAEKLFCHVLWSPILFKHWSSKVKFFSL